MKWTIRYLIPFDYKFYIKKNIKDKSLYYLNIIISFMTYDKFKW